MNLTLINVALVAAGGFLGGVGRFWLSGAIDRRTAETFPWGTLVVNVTGAVVIGILAGLMLDRGTHMPGQISAWAGLIAGFFGSYTTVSSFTLQTLALVRGGEIGRAIANVAASVVLCLAAAAAGYAAVHAASGPAAP